MPPPMTSSPSHVQVKDPDSYYLYSKRGKGAGSGGLEVEIGRDVGVGPIDLGPECVRFGLDNNFWNSLRATGSTES